MFAGCNLFRKALGLPVLAPPRLPPEVYLDEPTALHAPTSQDASAGSRPAPKRETIWMINKKSTKAENSMNDPELEQSDQFMNHVFESSEDEDEAQCDYLNHE